MENVLWESLAVAESLNHSRQEVSSIKEVIEFVGKFKDAVIYLYPGIGWRNNKGQACSLPPAIEIAVSDEIIKTE